MDIKFVHDCTTINMDFVTMGVDLITPPQEVYQTDCGRRATYLWMLNFDKITLFERPLRKFRHEMI